jgi:hypothetical protein
MDNYVEKVTGLLAAVLILVLLLTAGRARTSEKCSEALVSRFFGICHMGRRSTFYAASGKFAIF